MDSHDRDHPLYSACRQGRVALYTLLFQGQLGGSFTLIGKNPHYQSYLLSMLTMHVKYSV